MAHYLCLCVCMHVYASWLCMLSHYPHLVNHGVYGQTNFISLFPSALLLKLALCLFLCVAVEFPLGSSKKIVLQLLGLYPCTSETPYVFEVFRPSYQQACLPSYELSLSLSQLEHIMARVKILQFNNIEPPYFASNLFSVFV